MAGAVRFGRAHHDYPATDIFARCGSAVLAPISGRIIGVSRVDHWSSRTNRGADRGGLSVTVLGTDGVRYYGSHLRSLAASTITGHLVALGDRLGTVGNTGDARGIACHLHFGISPVCGQADWWNRRGMLTPYPYLKSWQDHQNRSPAIAVAALEKGSGCPRSARADP